MTEGCLTQQCQAAFNHLIQALCNEPILQYPSMEKPYMLFTNASHYTYSGILTQAVDSPEDLKPVAFMLGSFSKMYQWSSATKRRHMMSTSPFLSLTYT